MAMHGCMCAVCTIISGNNVKVKDSLNLQQVMRTHCCMLPQYNLAEDLLNNRTIFIISRGKLVEFCPKAYIHRCYKILAHLTACISHCHSTVHVVIAVAAPKAVAVAAETVLIAVAAALAV